MAKMLHMGFFTNYTVPDGWWGPWGGNDLHGWETGQFHVDLVKNAERAFFDLVVLEDASMVSEVYGGSFDLELKHVAEAPRLDPIMLAPLLANATEHIGIIPTISTSLYKPFQAERVLSTLDHQSSGRAGWNIVTSSEHTAAQNFGMDRLPAHDERYEWADEFVDVCEKLWASWEPGYLIGDATSRTWGDGSKVHRIDHDGRFFKSRGPLNVPPMPQGRPVYCQAGSSSRGREFAARHADVLLTQAVGLEKMKEFRDDIRRRAEAFGRDPDDIKVLYVVTPIISDSDAGAKARSDWLWEPSDWRAENSLAHMAAVMEIDFAQFDLDTPIPDLKTNGHQGGLEDFKFMARGSKTLREAANRWSIASIPLMGTPSTVADQIEETMDYVGGDGFLFASIYQMSRHYIATITDGLAPELQRRGMMRTSYSGDTLAQNLKAF